MKRNRVEIAVRGLLLAAAVIITLVIVALAFNQFEQAKGLSGVVSEQLSETTMNLKDANIKQYSETDMTGAEVRNFFKKYIGTASTQTGDFTVTITNSGGSASYTDGSGYANIEDSNSSGYVKPTSMYRCVVVINGNGVITEVTFTQK